VPLSDARSDGERRLLRGNRAHTPAALGFILGGFEADSLCRSDRPVTCFVSCGSQHLGQALGVVLRWNIEHPAHPLGQSLRSDHAWHGLTSLADGMTGGDVLRCPTKHLAAN
jgi:hypothetical protein